MGNLSPKYWFRVLIAVVVAAVIVSPAHSQINTDSTELEDLQSKWLKETFTNVKAVHIFVCELVQIMPPPDWLAREALKQEVKEYISKEFLSSGSYTIAFSDGKKHEADVLPCEYNNALEEPGHLNFIVKVILSRFPIDGRNIPFATISQYIYRPDHHGSIAAFLNDAGGPFVIDLSDEKLAKREFENRKTNWGVGFGNTLADNK